ncbi:hypothetical protein CR513_21163, partial [Mucuna pruriens]
MKNKSAACYDIESKIFNSRQGTLLYQGLKIYKADSIVYTGHVERGRIFKFLHGLNSEYDPIRVQILGKEKLCSLSKVFLLCEVKRPDNQSCLIKEAPNIGSAMVIGKGFTNRSTFEGKPFTKSSHGEYCTYCKRSGHTKVTRYKLYGKEKVLE